jgi:NAD(P)H-quinone oxidoreductase subunit 6
MTGNGERGRPVDRILSRAAAPAAAAALLAPAVAAAQAGPASQAGLADSAFYALAGLTLASAAGVAFSRNILYASFSLLGTFLGVAGLYVFLSADFLAVTQLLIYIGGVLVLILFAVMLTSRIQDIAVTNQSVGLLPAAVATALTTALLIFVTRWAPWKAPLKDPPLTPSADRLGDLFLNRYLLPFEIASVVLLATLIGAVVTARKEIKPD